MRALNVTYPCRKIKQIQHITHFVLDISYHMKTCIKRAIGSFINDIVPDMIFVKQIQHIIHPLLDISSYENLYKKGIGSLQNS